MNHTTSHQKKALLLLKTPPPYGGGEIRASWLKEYLDGAPGIKYIELNLTRRTRANQGNFSVIKVVEGFYYWLKIIWCLLSYRPGVVYKNFAQGGLPFIRDSIFVWTAKIFGVNFVCELAGERFRLLENGGIKRWYAKKVLSNIKSIRVLGASIKGLLEDNGIKNSFLMDNGVKVPENRKPTRLKEHHTIKFLFVGLHAPSKGFDILIKSLKDIKRNGHKFELHTIGQWERESFMKQMEAMIAEPPSLVGDITFHGLKSGTAKWEIFDSCHVLLLPSLTEGQPLSILEALSFGMTVIATSVGGIPDVIKNGENGFLISPNSSTQLTGAMENILSDTDLINTISRKNIELYETRFTISTYMNNYIKWLLA